MAATASSAFLTSPSYSSSTAVSRRIVLILTVDIGPWSKGSKPDGGVSRGVVDVVVGEWCPSNDLSCGLSDFFDSSASVRARCAFYATRAAGFTPRRPSNVAPSRLSSKAPFCLLRSRTCCLAAAVTVAECWP